MRLLTTVDYERTALHHKIWEVTVSLNLWLHSGKSKCGWNKPLLTSFKVTRSCYDRWHGLTWFREPVTNPGKQTWPFCLFPCMHCWHTVQDVLENESVNLHSDIGLRSMLLLHACKSPTSASNSQTSNDDAKSTPPPRSQIHPVCLPAQPWQHIHLQGNTETSCSRNTFIVL